MPYPLTDPLKPKPAVQPLGTPKPAIAQPDPLQAQHKKLRADFDAAGQRATTFRNQQAAIAIPAPIIKEGRMSVSSIPNPATNAAVSARRTLGERAAVEDATRSAMIPAFRNLTTAFQDQTAKNRAVATAGDANRLLSGVGAATAPVPFIAAPAPAVKPSVAPATTSSAAQPRVIYRDQEEAPSSSFRSPAPVAAAPKLAPIAQPGGLNTFTGSSGRTVTVPGGGQGTQGASTTSAPITTAIASPAGLPMATIPRPGTASTFGQSVISMPDDNVLIDRPGSSGTFRGPDAMSEQFRSREDREARQALASDLGTEAFLLRGKNDPASLRAMADIADTRAGLVSGGERLAAQAIANRGENDTNLATTGMVQQGENRRAEIGFQTVQMQDATENRRITTAAIERPGREFITDAAGRRLQVVDGRATPITDTSGAAISMPGQQQDNRGQVTPELIYQGARDELDQLLRAPVFGAADDPGVQAHNQRVMTLRQQIAALEQKGSDAGAVKVATKAEFEKLPRGTRYLAPDGRTYTKP